MSFIQKFNFSSALLLLYRITGCHYSFFIYTLSSILYVSFLWQRLPFFFCQTVFTVLVALRFSSFFLAFMCIKINCVFSLLQGIKLIQVESSILATSSFMTCKIWTNILSFSSSKPFFGLYEFRNYLLEHFSFYEMNMLALSSLFQTLTNYISNFMVVFIMPRHVCSGIFLLILVLIRGTAKILFLLFHRKRICCQLSSHLFNKIMKKLVIFLAAWR